MHLSSYVAGNLFANIYGGPNKIVVDLGGKNVNGSLRNFFENLGMKYICVDMDEHSSVDIIVKPGEKLPFDNNSIDLIVSTSCFEHDPCFWMTFKEMTRIIKDDGFIYVNAPSNGPYHGYPGDNWRFYGDAGQALSYWSGIQIADEVTFPMKIVETFTIIIDNVELWHDFICIWQRTDKKEENIIVPDHINNNIGILEKSLNDSGYPTKKH
jgi:SAM-dependent methyltransferase